MGPSGLATVPATVKAIVTRLEGGALDLKLAQDAAALIKELASQLQPEGLEVDTGWSCPYEANPQGLIR